MREQNGKMIAIASPKQTTFFLPRISQLTYNQSPSSLPGLHNSKNRKEKSKKFKVSSLDKICLRECCKRKRQVDNINTAQVIAKKQRFMAINKHNNDSHLNNKHHPNRKNETVSRQKKRTLTYQGEIRLKNKIFVLHSLKQFEPQDIQQYQNAEMYQRETKHKVNTSQSRKKIIECKNDFIKNNMRLKNHTQQQSNNLRSQRYSKEKKEQEQDNHRTKNSYIYNDEVTKRSNHKQMAKDSSQNDDARTSLTKQYYRYIENHKKLGDQGAKNLRKATNTQYDQQKSEESLFKSQLHKENSTIFHSHKIKFGSSLKQSRIKSSRILSKDQIYKIPQTEDQKTQFLLNYKPLDPDFNLRSLVSKQNFKILDKEDKVYFGLVKGEQKHGLGILLSQKEIYEGQFMADQKFKGIQKTKQGMYFGTFVRGMREGQAKFIWKNGEEFIGEWKNGKKDGYGIWKSPKGDYYEGEWKNNKQNGKGLFVHIAGSKYNGYFKNFLKHGKGEQEFATGDKYVGQYKHGKPHGFGKYIWVNGDIYKGEFIEGSRQGKGILTKSNSESYQGSFINDMKEGQGRQSYANGDYFEGSFEQDVKIKGKLYNKKEIFLSQLK